MDFTSYNYEVYQTEVDDHGVDFICKKKGDSNYKEIQVKSLLKSNYVFIPKHKMPNLTEDRLIYLLLFADGKVPEAYIVPATVWLHPDDLFVEKNYESSGLKSKPEWGISITKKNIGKLEVYKAVKYFSNGKKKTVM